MSKIKINYKLNNKMKSTIGIKNKNRITFIDDDVNFKLIISDDLTIVRENKEYKLELKLGNKNECKYTLKNYNDIYMSIEKIKLDLKDNKISTVYKLNDEIFSFELNYEVIE